MQTEVLTIEIIPNKEVSKDIIMKYWEYNAPDFRYSPKQLAFVSNIKLSKFHGIIKNFSKVCVNAGVCHCGKEVIKPIATRNILKKELDNISSKKQVICAHCEEINHKENIALRLIALQAEKEHFRDYKFQQMNIAIKESRWEKLTENEVEKLFQIARAYSKKEIYNILLPKGLNGKELKPYWDILEKFDKLDLIWIERDLPNLSIIDIHKLPELASAIYSYYNTEVANKGLLITEEINEIKFSLKRNLDRTHIRQPEYSGSFYFVKDIILKKGVKYTYGGWLNDDGSLHIKITPINSESLHSREVIPKDNDNGENPLSQF